MEKVYGDDCPAYDDVVKKWRRQFNSDRTWAKTAPIPRRPHSTIDEHTIQRMVAIRHPNPKPRDVACSPKARQLFKSHMLPKRSMLLWHFQILRL